MNLAHWGRGALWTAVFPILAVVIVVSGVLQIVEAARERIMDAPRP